MNEIQKQYYERLNHYRQQCAAISRNCMLQFEDLRCKEGLELAIQYAKDKASA